MERGRIQGLSEFFGTPNPLLSRELVKLRTSNLASTFAGPIRIKIRKKVMEKRARGRIQGLPNFLGTPYYLGNGKATDFKFCRNIHRVDRNKSL